MKACRSLLVATALAAAVGAVTAATPAQQRARTNYIHHCSGCHLVDGSGAPSKGIPSMHDTLSRFLQVSGGREYIVQVPGVMNSPLGDRDIAELMNWLLPKVSPGGLPPGLQPYSAAEIGALRKTRPVDFAATREKLIEEARQAGITNAE